jgi:hypothetical protein
MIATMRMAMLVGVTAVLAAAAPAQAVELVPPGKAGASQYFETIPSVGGNAAPPAGAPSNVSPQSLAPFGRGRAGAIALAHLGTSGQAAAALATATAPRPASGGANRGPTGGSSPLSAIAKALPSSSAGGLGLVLPLVLASVLVLALGVGLRRFTRGTGPATGA